MTIQKLIPVSVWAAQRYDPSPSDWVLRRWCRDGEIYPAPAHAEWEGRQAPQVYQPTRKLAIRSRALDIAQDGPRS